MKIIHDQKRPIWLYGTRQTRGHIWRIALQGVTVTVVLSRRAYGTSVLIAGLKVGSRI